MTDILNNKTNTYFMTTKMFPLLLMICTNSFCQEIQLNKLSDKKMADGSFINFYSLKIYNNTDKPICVPVSIFFAHRVNFNDTLELVDIYNDQEDSVVEVGLVWAKKDLDTNPQQMESYPIVLNPGTYIATNVAISKGTITKKIYFDFRHSFGPDLNYQKISSSYNTEPKFVWKKSLMFIEKKVPMEL